MLRAAVVTCLLGLVSGAALAAGGMDRLRLEYHLATVPEEALTREVSRLEQNASGLRQGIERMLSAAAARRPSGTYIVIDAATNRLLLRRDDEILLDAVCSTGSGQELVDGKRRWVFNTPRGSFKVLSKVNVPVWIKPDWAFIEEGKRPPGPRAQERYEEGVLGEYALTLGDGYMIHGTVYKRLLGKSVTHGCIRLDDDALAQVFAQSVVGTPVYIF